MTEERQRKWRIGISLAYRVAATTLFLISLPARNIEVMVMAYLALSFAYAISGTAK